MKFNIDFAILLLGITIFIWSLFERKKETFETPRDTDIKYENAYYFEYTNDIYNAKLKQIFEYKDNNTLLSNIGYLIKPPEDIYIESNVSLMDIYDQCISYIRKIIRITTVLDITYTNEPIQVINEQFIGYYLALPDVYLVIHCVFFREGKYAGKQIKFILKYDIYNTVVTFLTVKVIDTISADNLVLPGSDEKPFETIYENVSGVETSMPYIPEWQQISVLRADPRLDLQPTDSNLQQKVLQKSLLFN